MNLIYGEIVDLDMEDEMPIGSIRVSGAIKKVPLGLIADVQCGDRVLMCDGVAIAKANDSQITNPENHVSRDSR